MRSTIGVEDIGESRCRSCKQCQGQELRRPSEYVRVPMGSKGAAAVLVRP